MLESLFDKVPDLQAHKRVSKSPCRSAIQTPKQVFSCEICQIFKDTYFKEHQRTAASKNKSNFPAGVYLLKVNKRNTRTKCEICSKLPIKKPERFQLCVGVMNCFHLIRRKKLITPTHN